MKYLAIFVLITSCAEMDKEIKRLRKVTKERQEKIDNHFEDITRYFKRYEDKDVICYLYFERNGLFCRWKKETSYVPEDKKNEIQSEIF